MNRDHLDELVGQLRSLGDTLALIRTSADEGGARETANYLHVAGIALEHIVGELCTEVSS